EGNYLGAATNAMGAGFPVAGMAGKLASAAGAFPKSLAAGAGLSGLLSDMSQAGDRKPKASDWWRTPRRAAPATAPFVEPTLTPQEEQRYTAPEIQGFDKLGPQAKLQSIARKDEMQKGLLRDREQAAKDKIARARADWDAGVQQAQAGYEAEQARLDAEDEQ